MPTDREMVREERELLAALDLPDTYFWAAHSLNSVPIQGFLREDGERMLAALDRSIGRMRDTPSIRISRTGSL